MFRSFLGILEYHMVWSIGLICLEGLSFVWPAFISDIYLLYTYIFLNFHVEIKAPSQCCDGWPPITKNLNEVDFRAISPSSKACHPNHLLHQTHHNEV